MTVTVKLPYANGEFCRVLVRNNYGHPKTIWIILNLTSGWKIWPLSSDHPTTATGGDNILIIISTVGLLVKEAGARFYLKLIITW